MRPVGRLPPELFAAAKQFVFDFRDGQTQHIAGEMEPELYALLQWLAEQSMLEAEKRRRPEEVGREILGYRDANTSVAWPTAPSGQRWSGRPPSTAVPKAI